MFSIREELLQMSSKYYSLDFKLEVVKGLHRDGERATDVVKKLGMKFNDL